MKIEKFIQNIFAENTYLIWDENSKEAVIIDPGCVLPEEEREISEFIRRENLHLKYLLNTHCHLDHIFGNSFIKRNYNVQFYAPKGDMFLFDILVEHAKEFGIKANPSPLPDKNIDESLILNFGGMQIKFISTPGHTPDSYCVYFEKEKVCFTGDVLFSDGIGRTDLWGGSFDELILSIKGKLFLLPDIVTIYPGHGDESTIGYEKNNNSFLN